MNNKTIELIAFGQWTIDTNLEVKELYLPVTLKNASGMLSTLGSWKSMANQVKFYPETKEEGDAPPFMPYPLMTIRSFRQPQDFIKLGETPELIKVTKDELTQALMSSGFEEFDFSIDKDKGDWSVILGLGEDKQRVVKNWAPRLLPLTAQSCGGLNFMFSFESLGSSEGWLQNVSLARAIRRSTEQSVEQAFKSALIDAEARKALLEISYTANTSAVGRPTMTEITTNDYFGPHLKALVQDMAKYGFTISRPEQLSGLGPAMSFAVRILKVADHE